MLGWRLYLTTRFEFALLDFLEYSTIKRDPGAYNKFFRELKYDYDYDYGGRGGRKALEKIFNVN